MLRQDRPPPILENWTVSTGDDIPLPARICAEHLVLLGAKWKTSTHKEEIRSKSLSAGKLSIRPKMASRKEHFVKQETHCTIEWPNLNNPELQALGGNEAIIQAISGLMQVHGRDHYMPRRLGLEVASVAAGIIATQGVLASLIAQNRGIQIQEVETTVLQAALLFLRHHLAIATCQDKLPFPIASVDAGPPFCTSDGNWVECEILSFESWNGFWKTLGVNSDVIQEAWLPFVYRYLSGQCSLPARLHETTARHTLSELMQIASANKVAVCRLQTYIDLLKGLNKLQGSQPREDSAGFPFEAPWTISSGTKCNIKKDPLQTASKAPLAGLRVVEVTSRLQGPLAGLLLLMLGAEVIKVEPPGGDFGRFSPPLAGSYGAAYLAYNRGKQTVEIDYKLPRGRDQLRELLANSDIFLHNWPSGRAEKLGFDFTSLSEINSSLIYAHASGWGGLTHEPSPIAGDYLVQAYAGCGNGLNPSSDPPFPSRLTILDVIGGLLACEGILAGVYWRECNGMGCQINTSLLTAALALQNHILQAILKDEESGRHMGRPMWGPLDQPLETADGYLIIALQSENDHHRLAQLCGIKTAASDLLMDDQIIKEIRSRSALEWEHLLLASGIPSAVIRMDLASLAEDRHTVHYLQKVQDACWLPACPWQFK
jgi:crotonobetainyl-CoA:carnitine CoA-transferase CaiB-like acyl-CoA transferase